MQKSLIVVLITAVIVAVFAVLNADPVSINLIFAKYEMSQAVVILVSAVIGALTMYILNAFQAAKLKKQVKQLSKKLIDSDSANAKLQASLDECKKKEDAQKNIQNPVIENESSVAQGNEDATN